MPIRIHFLQHVNSETSDYVSRWADSRSFPYAVTKLYKQETLPRQEDFDFLVILGGPMSVFEEELYPWLKEEKAFIRQTIQEIKLILGICLGCQLIDSCSGGELSVGTPPDKG